MPMSPRSALITGAGGFLGKHLVRHLTNAGWEVTIADRTAGDFTNWDNVKAVFSTAPKVDRIFHLITQQRTGPIQLQMQGELLANNSRIHLNVLEAWRQLQPQAKLITTGSSCAFPESSSPLPEEQFQGGKLHNSVRGYGIAKQLLAVGSETYASQYGLKYLHLFLATLYGPDDYTVENRAHFMTGMINRALEEKAANSENFTVWGSPDTVRDLLYIDDQIDAILAADGHFENTFLNCTSNEPVKIGGCAEAVLEALDWNVNIVYPSGTFKGTDYKTLDSSLFLSTTGWQPNINLVEGVKKVIAA